MSANYHHCTSINGQITGYHLSGNGSCIVFLHGYMENHRVWLPVTNNIVGYTVLIPDISGDSNTQTGNEESLLQKIAQSVHLLVLNLGFNTYSVVGNSMGGYFALQMLYRYGDFIEKAVLVSTNLFDDTTTKKKKRKQEINLLRAGKKSLVGKVFINSLSSENLKKLYGLMLTEASERSLIAFQEGMLRKTDFSNIRDLIVSMPQKIYYLYGKSDHMIPVTNTEHLLKRHSRVVSEMVKDGTHFVVAEQPQVVTQFILTAFNT